MKLVIAENRESYLSFCRENGLTAHTRTANFVSCYEIFMDIDPFKEKLTPVQVVCYGNWKESWIYKDQEIWRFFVDYARDKKWSLPDGL